MSGPIMVEGPDGQRYEFPEGTSPEVMRGAMAKRYPKPDPVYSEKPSDQNPLGITQDEATGAARSQMATQNAPKPGFNDRVTYAFNDYMSDVDLSPQNLSDNLAATISGINNAAYRGLDDEIAGGIGKATGFKPLQQYEATQDDLRARKPGAFMGGQITAGLGEGGALTQMLQPKNIMQAIGIGGAVGASEAAAWGTGDADRPDQNRALEGAKMAPYGALFGGAMGGGIGTVSKLLAGPDGKAIAAELQAVADREIRPQALKAIRRLLNASGVSDSDISALNNEVSKRIQAIDGSAPGAEGRKRLFQHYIEVLAGDEASPLYNPQAAANVLMTVQERANTAVRGDTSRGIVGSAVKADRASQVPFLEESAGNIAQGTRLGTKAQVKETRADLGNQYEAVLNGNIAPEAQQQAFGVIESIRPLLDGPSGLKVQAAAEGVDIDTLIARNPVSALHWIGVAARRKAQSADPNRAAYAALRQRAVDTIEAAVPEYRDLRRNYATNEGLDNAITFGDRLFGGAQSNMMNNPGMRAELVDEFNSLTPAEQQIALGSIRDQALGKLAGGAEGAPARVTQLNTQAALDFLEQVGAKQFADDVRAIARENQLLSVADAGNPLRQSATFSNAQARADAPPLYESRLANAVNESTPGTLMGEAMLMTFAPHYQGAYAAYRGSRLAAKMGFGTRKKTLEDMTRYLMSRREPVNALATPPAASTPPTSTTPVGGSSTNALAAAEAPRANPYMGRRSFRGAEEARGPKPGTPDDPKTSGAGDTIAGLLMGGGMLSAAGSVGGEDSPVGRARNAFADVLAKAELPETSAQRFERMRSQSPLRAINNDYVPASKQRAAAQEGRDLVANALALRRRQLETAAPSIVPPQDRLTEMRGRLEQAVAAGELSQGEAWIVMNRELARAGRRASENPFRKENTPPNAFASAG